MSLFTIKRFQGDSVADNKSHQQALLENLQQRIKARTEKSKTLNDNTNSTNDQTKTIKKKPKNKVNKKTSSSYEDDKESKTDKDLERKKRQHVKSNNDITDYKVTKKKQKKNKLKEEESDHLELSNNEQDIKKQKVKMIKDTAEKDDIKDEDVNSPMEEDKDEEDMNVEDVEKKDEDLDVFTVLGDVENKKKKKVQRVLPDWLAQPTIVDHDIKHNQTDVRDMKGLDQRIITMLKENNITHFFPVQSKVIPTVLASLKLGLHIGNVGYRPRDVCVSAPTGSGKTLAFVVPVVQALLDRVIPQVRALIVLPTKELADQVYAVFSTYCTKTALKLALVAGSKPFAKEQELLVRQRSEGCFCSLVDIVVATPGRLVDHINLTEGFTLQHLRFLVIDEADRMMDNISKGWIAEVEKSAFPGGECRPVPAIITPSSVSSRFPPLQKLLFSATLSQNPEKLTQLKLFHPELLTSVIKTSDASHDNKGEFVGKFTTPVELTEFMINCTAGEKPLMVLHLIINLCFNNVLCFTNTIEETHRLYLLIKAIGSINVEEFSSLLSKKRRAEILKKFKAGKIQILIASDAMARGMDVENVRCVISYDVPPFIKTYIHRVGRTARAGRAGIAFSLVQKSEATKFKSMLSNVGKMDIKPHRVRRQHLESLEQQYEDALRQLQLALKEEKAIQYAV